MREFYNLEFVPPCVLPKSVGSRHGSSGVGGTRLNGPVRESWLV